MWVAEGVTEIWWRVERAPLLPLGPYPTYSATTQQGWLPHPGKYLRLCPLLDNRCTKTKTTAQMKEQIKAPEKTQLSDEEIANLSDAQPKTLVIRMLTELAEHGCKIEEEVKAMKSEIKENAQGPNSDGKETRTRINDLDKKEERHIQPEQNEETRIQKNEARLRNLQDNLKCSSI